MTKEKIIEVLKKFTQLMRVTKSGEARMGISKEDYNSLADELLSLAKAEQPELCQICKESYLVDKVCLQCTRTLASPINLPNPIEQPTDEDIEKWAEEYIKEECPGSELPFHYNREVAFGVRDFIVWMKKNKAMRDGLITKK